MLHSPAPLPVTETKWVFDQPHTQRISEARRDFLHRVLRAIDGQLPIKRAADLGCGIGYFSGVLSAMGLEVVGVDGREQNVTEAARRLPHVTFHTQDAERLDIAKLGVADFTLCFGLLYHLENPFSAIRGIFEMTRGAVLLESRIIPGQQPIAAVIDESQGADQGLRYVAMIPTQACMVAMLSRAGFEHVYTFDQPPEHEDYTQRPAQRAVVLASRVALHAPGLMREAQAPRLRYQDYLKITGAAQ